MTTIARMRCILDFPHAAERVALVGQGVWGEQAPESQAWLTDQLHQLKHEGPAPVLAELHCLMEQPPGHATLQEHVTYLEKRQGQMHYPDFQAAGWPIGDGAVEGSNKLVVEARLKGSGMHWARSHVDPMLALRNIACNDRWAEAWPQITTTLRQQDRQRRAERRHQRRADRAARLEPIPAPSPGVPDAVPTPVKLSSAPMALPKAPAGRLDLVNLAAPAKPAGPWRPPAYRAGAFQAVCQAHRRKNLNRTPSGVCRLPGRPKCSKIAHRSSQNSKTWKSPQIIKSLRRSVG